jgi:hypothetical protein
VNNRTVLAGAIVRAFSSLAPQNLAEALLEAHPTISSLPPQAQDHHPFCTSTACEQNLPLFTSFFSHVTIPQFFHAYQYTHVF